MKFILPIISLIVTILLTGCVQKRTVLVPQSEYYPSFPMTGFEKFEPIEIDTYVREYQENNKTTVFIVVEQNEFLRLVEYTKNLRETHNLLIDKITTFNRTIQDLNKRESNKKPQILEDLDTLELK